MAYHLTILKKAEKEIQKLPRDLAQKIIHKIYDLQKNPRPLGCKKLTDFQSERAPGKVCFRIRQGEYRIVYTVEDEVITIMIVQVQHRKEVYKR